MKACIIAEHNNQVLQQVNRHVISAAKELASEIDVLVIGNDCQQVVEAARLLPAVNRVLVCDHAVYAHQLAENCAPLIAEVCKNYDYLLAAATTFGKNLLPRAAALLDVAMVSDVCKILAPNTFIRPMYAGNVMAKVEASDKLKVLSVRTTVFPEAKDKNTTAAAIEKLSLVIENKQSKFEKQTLTKSTRPELTEARVVISGGRGLKSGENFKLLEKIADHLGAAIGASRAAVDAGFAPNDYQVGQTGKVVAPDLYIAVGISGAIQHLAGIKDSKVIVAINNDPDAPIFQIADYRIVGDLFKILPELEQALTSETNQTSKENKVT